MVRIALFGTSADPPHRGHGAILQWLATQFDHVAVWAADNPFKRDQTPLADRTAMLRLLVEDLSPPSHGAPQRVAVYPGLSHRRTIVTIERAQQRWPGADLALVVGADIAQQLPEWYRVTEIFAQVPILVVPRPGYPLNGDTLDQLRQQGARVAIADTPEQHDVSSSDYRATEETTDLPPVVQAYIHQNQLYPCPENSREKQPIR